jgi:hypothetical protein
MNLLKQGATLALAMTMALAGCSGKDGSNGVNGQPGPSTGTLAGKVTIAGTNNLPVVGATVALSPAVAGVSIATNATGDYSAVVPVGVYTLTITAPNLVTQTKTVSVIAATTATQNVALVATAPVVVGLTVTGTATPGAALNVTAVATPLDGSTVTGVLWTTGVNAPATFGSTTAASTTATLPTLATLKANLFRVAKLNPLADPDANSNPPELPPLGIGDLNRFQVQPINNFDLERAAEVTLTATVTTTNPTATYSVTKVVSATLPWGTTLGTASVPVNVPVLVHGTEPVPPAVLTYNYTLAYTAVSTPADATSLLDSTTGANPVFTPNAAGKYTLTETVSGASIDIYAGTFVGAIDPAATLAAADPTKPVGDANCLGCHDNTTAPDKFTPWAQSGHASIFTQNVVAGGHYTKDCFGCHTVGYLTGANGIDQQADFATMLTGMFTANGSPVANANNWKTILQLYPASAKMANIQCENCHGPNQNAQSSHSGSATRGAIKVARVSWDAGVCGKCHGEPARHGRYQEWSISGHANFGSTATVPTTEGALILGINPGCSGCHSAQGSAVYFAQLQSGIPNRNITLPAGLTVDTVQPQTCAVCHDPHDPGTTSSAGTDAQPRITGNTPLLAAGFDAIGVGKGAICITCHNSRNGGWNDTTVTPNVYRANLHEDGDAHFGTLAAFAAPHEAAQGDVLMGRNAYFVSGVRGPHSLVPNACVNCHMDSVAAPSELGYSTQTNHTFQADLTICAKCHGAFDGAGLQAATAAGLDDLVATINAKIVALYETAGATAVVTPGRTPTIVVTGATPFSGNLSTYLTGKAASAGSVDTFAKANWNYELVAVDNSGGVHNPSFVQDVIFRTAQKVNALTTP